MRELSVLRAYLEEQGELADGRPLSDAWATVETFCAVALRVISQTNPSKVRDCARTVEIQYLMK